MWLVRDRPMLGDPSEGVEMRRVPTIKWSGREGIRSVGFSSGNSSQPQVTGDCRCGFAEVERDLRFRLRWVEMLMDKCTADEPIMSLKRKRANKDTTKESIYTLNAKKQIKIRLSRFTL